MLTANRLLLIDGHAILHRAFHALPPLTNREGKQTNAVYGFTNMMLHLLETIKPTYLAVAFDLPTPTFRMQIWTQYQEKRPEMQSNLAEQIPLVHELLEALKVPYFEVPGYEADDVIGTIAQMSSRRRPGSIEMDSGSAAGMTTTIVTGDRDLLQLVNDNVKVVFPVKGLSVTKTYGPQEVKTEFGVRPDQWIDVKALKGDSSDNYPGVRGIGPKTAEKLIAEFETLENVYKNIDKIDKKTALKLAEGAEMAGLSQKLATILTDAPIKFDPDLAKVENIDWVHGLEYMRGSLGFRSIADKIEKGLKKANELDTAKVLPGEQMELI